MIVVVVVYLYERHFERGSSEITPIQDKLIGSLSFDHMRN